MHVSACLCAFVPLFYGDWCDGTAVDIQSTPDEHCGSFQFLSWLTGNAYVWHYEMMSLIWPGFFTFAGMIDLLWKVTHLISSLLAALVISCGLASSQTQLVAALGRVDGVVSFSDLQGTHWFSCPCVAGHSGGLPTLAAFWILLALLEY